MDVYKGDAVLEHQALICLANDVFGSLLWNHSVIHQNIDFIDNDSCSYSVGVTALVKVELKSGVYHQEAGYGTYNDKSKGVAVATAQKRAVTIALREALRSFGGEITKRLNQIGVPVIPEAKPVITPVNQNPFISCKTPPAQKHNSPSNSKNIVHSTMVDSSLKSSGTNIVNHSPEPATVTPGGSNNMDLDDIEMKLERKRRQKQKQEEFLKKLKQKHTTEDSSETKSEFQHNTEQNNGQVKGSTVQNGCKALTLDIEDEALISTQEMNQMVQSAVVKGVSPAVNNRVPLFSTPATNCPKSASWSAAKENSVISGKTQPKYLLSTRRMPLQQNN